MGNVSACHGAGNLLSLSRVVLSWELCCFSSRFPKGRRLPSPGLKEHQSRRIWSLYSGVRNLLGTPLPNSATDRSLPFREDIWDYSGSEIILAAGPKTRLGDGIAPRPSRLRSQTSDLEAAGSPARSGMLRDRSLVSCSLRLPSPPLLAPDQSAPLWNESGSLRISLPPPPHTHTPLPTGRQVKPRPRQVSSSGEVPSIPRGISLGVLLDGGVRSNLPSSSRRRSPKDPIRGKSHRGRLFTSVG